MRKGIDTRASSVKRLFRDVSKFSVVFVLLIIGCSEEQQINNPPSPVSSAAWIVNSLAESLSKLNLETGQVDTNAILLGTYPNEIVIQDDKAYVVNSGSNNLQIIDLNTQQTVGTIEILLGINPYNVVLENSSRAFVTNWLTNNVSILDLQTGLETDTIRMDGATPQGLCITADHLYVTDVNYQYPNYQTGHLYSYSLPDLYFIGRLDVGLNPQIVKMGPDGNLHVVCSGNFNDISGQIDIVDPQTFQIEDSIAIGGSPGSLVFNSSGIAYLGSAGWAGPGYVLSYDGTTHQIIHGEQNPIVVSSAALGVTLSAADHVFICCFNTDEVVELDAQGDSLRTYIVGNGPLSIALQ